jgi:murein DD-endopeptidase MepM/ murein hydrolase activator NlpD
LHLILVSDRLATAKTISLTPRHLFAALAVLTALVISLSSFFSYLTVRHAAEIRLPFLQDLLRGISAEERQRSADFVRENLNVMAIKLGEMQAQLTRLDTLGQRLASFAGVKPQELKAIEESIAGPGRGGPLLQPSQVNPADLTRALEILERQVEAKTDTLTLLESQLLDERIRKSLLPTSLPVDADWNASAFGWRFDPFTGQRSMHEGVDFVAPPGTSIKAAAAGIVLAAELHPAYGKMIEIDHGGELITRYAHASKLLVKPGQLIKRGQKIAEVGSTGRSTGPHLHFEVRVRGVSQNPERFLRQGDALARAN